MLHVHGWGLRNRDIEELIDLFHERPLALPRAKQQLDQLPFRLKLLFDLLSVGLVNFKVGDDGHRLDQQPLAQPLHGLGAPERAFV